MVFGTHSTSWRNTTIRTAWAPAAHLSFARSPKLIVSCPISSERTTMILACVTPENSQTAIQCCVLPGPTKRSLVLPFPVLAHFLYDSQIIWPSLDSVYEQVRRN